MILVLRCSKDMPSQTRIGCIHTIKSKGNFEQKKRKKKETRDEFNNSQGSSM